MTNWKEMSCSGIRVRVTCNIVCDTFWPVQGESEYSWATRIADCGDTHVPTLDTKTDNNRPYNRPYHFALPTDLWWYRYRRAPMYLRSFHATDLTNTKWSSIPRWFRTSHIPLRLPNIIPMIQSDQHIDNIETLVISRRIHTSEYLRSRLKRQLQSYWWSGYHQFTFQYMVLVVLFDFAMFCFIFSLCLSFT